MSEPKLITPLLAEHIMGEPISDHHGVRCCPAMLKDSDRKFIVKIISIPASSVQLDALLLTGAYATKEDALKYFKELTDAVVEEAKLLEKLSRLEGFHAYLDWQIEPMEDGTGYDVYLLGDYRLTLERHMRRSNLTHLAAVNLGIDLCSALSVCRRNGYLYVDLKPENIFITENNEYRIADLGFIRLSSLKYASLPDKYRSAYTAPEIEDAYSALNTTLDVYAAGLILYQVFNDGKLPTPGEDLLPPAYADYEMAEIILKAIAVDPVERWEDPQLMAQALVSYMQRNVVNDTPIIPLPAPQPDTIGENPVKEPVMEETPAESVETEAAVEEFEPSEEEFAAEEEEFEDPFNVEVVDDPALLDAVLQSIPQESSAEITETVSGEEVNEEELAETVIEESVPEEAEEPVDELEQFVMDGFEIDETHPSEEYAHTLDVDVTEEVGDMLALADELISHPAPDPVVAPEAVDIPMPEPILPEKPEDPAQEESQTQETSEEEAPEGAEAQAEETAAEVEEEEVEELPPIPVGKDNGPKKKKLRGLIIILVAILLSLCVAAAGFWYYENVYVQHIYGFELEAEDTQLTVHLDTRIDNQLLTVYLTDIYGNKLHQKVENNQATFTGLPAGTTYNISVTIDGFHKLVCASGASYATPAETNIVSFSAIAADTDGSVILNFSVQGPDNTNWFVKYSAEDEEELTAACTGHMASITGLTVGKTYTFQLVPETDLYVVGNDSMEYTALPVIYAENLAIKGFEGNVMQVTWNAPEDITVNSWTVRCYNSDGFDTTFTVTEPQAAIEVPDATLGYTVDVKAEGMSVSKWTSVTANSITFNDISFDESVPGQLTISWIYAGNAPEEGWLLMYTVDGSEKYLVQSTEASCTISPLIPGGVYSISFVLPDDITVFGGSATYTAPAAEKFSGYGVSADNISFVMCPTPEETNWIWYDIWTGYYTRTFVTGQKASLIAAIDAKWQKSSDEISTLYVVKNSEGIPISINEGRVRTWTGMWNQNHSELDLPVTPSTPGNYTVDIYFAGQYVTTQSFSIVPEMTEEPGTSTENTEE